MTSALERLADLTAEPADAKEFASLKDRGLSRLKDAGERRQYPGRALRHGLGDLEVNERIVADLIAACRAVAVKLEQLEPLR